VEEGVSCCSCVDGKLFVNTQLLPKRSIAPGWRG
jgi:hypothetical protein